MLVFTGIPAFARMTNWAYSSAIRIRPFFIAAAVAVAPALSSSLWAATDSADPAELVRKMSVALKTLNYEGTFVHVQGTHITSMHILHSSDAEGELERLASLDGESREVIRNNVAVTCIWHGSEAVFVSESKPRELLPKVSEDLANNKRYVLTLDTPDRVAGLATYVVNVEPIDAQRYGHRFWIDKDTHMLLRSTLLGSDRKIVEQMMFTDIEYPESIDLERFDVSPDENQLSWLQPASGRDTSGLPKLLKPQVDRVQFNDLPSGYREVSETYSPMPINGNDGPISHVMLSDGMASVSVYVEYIGAADQDLSTAGLSSMGAMNAFGLSTSTAFITAVGEVPAEAVRAIAMSVTLEQ